MGFPKLSSRNKRRLKTSRNNVVEKQKRILSNTQFQTVQQNEKKNTGKKGPIGPQKKRHQKVHQKVKRVKIDIALNATAMEDSDFSSASAGPSR